MQTLSQKYPETKIQLQRAGYVHIAALMDRFYRSVDMDKALGRSGASNQWMNRNNMPSKLSEEKARAVIGGAVVTPRPTPEPIKEMAASDADVILVAVPAGKSEKVKRVLEMLGCEVVE